MSQTRGECVVCVELLFTVWYIYTGGVYRYIAMSIGG